VTLGVDADAVTEPRLLADLDRFTPMEASVNANATLCCLAVCCDFELQFITARRLLMVQQL
jgi:hypothetical protein